MPSAVELANQQRLLEKHRRNLALLEEQAASFGGETFAPLYVINGLQETREAIQRIEDDIRAGRVSPSEVVSTDRNRTAMLAKVKAIWVDGLLANSLDNEVRIALDLVEQPGAVALPLNALVQELNRAPRPLPPHTPIVDVFDASNGALLILGVPGAGKTTLLLELTRDLITRAGYDETHPIPVVFNLSSWAQKRQALTSWLADELNTKYDVPRKLAQDWVIGDVLLPLLDGLDEVQQELRDECVEAINAYRSEHGLVPLVVCSRITDYEGLSTKLRLQNAVVVQSLTPHQIDTYLNQIGEPLAGLKIAIGQDTMLRELATTPLMLAIMMLAYRGVDVEQLEVSDTPEHQQKLLFDAYLDGMFTRRGASSRYTRDSTMRWLTWLARGMQQRGQSIFLIERLQPDSLLTQDTQWQYVLVDRLGWALVFGLVFGLAFGLIFGLIFGLDFGLFFVLAGGLGGGLLAGLFGSSTTFSLRDRPRIGHVVANVTMGWLVIGLVEGLIVAVSIRPESTDREVVVVVRTLMGLVGGLIFGLVGGLAGLLTGMPQVHPRQIVVVERLRWSWRKGWSSGLLGVVGGTVFGVANGVLGGVFGALSDTGGGSYRSFNLVLWLVGGLAFGLFLGLVIGPISGLIFGLLGGLTYGDVTTHVIPNQGIRRSARSAILSGLILGLFFALIGGLVLVIGFAVVLHKGLALGLGFGFTYGLTVGLAFGGYAVLSHLALRFVLWRHGAMPLNYVRFLDYCVDRIFLRRVGGGYIFVHRMLLEHFASLDTSQASSKTPRQPASTSRPTV